VCSDFCCVCVSHVFGLQATDHATVMSLDSKPHKLLPIALWSRGYLPLKLRRNARNGCESSEWNSTTQAPWDRSRDVDRRA
jgi:hypothetical protein